MERSSIKFKSRLNKKPMTMSIMGNRITVLKIL